MKLRPPTYQTLIWDVESDGLLDTMTVIHCLAIREYETGRVWRFRKNKKEDTIAKGIAMLADCAAMVGHNIMDFDLDAVRIVFPDWNPHPDCVIEDTLVYVRLLFADQKDKDFETWRRGKLPGQLIGVQSLEAWGHRLNLHKGDYSKDRKDEAKALGLTEEADIMRHVWGTWNQSMDDYCLGDIDVTTKLWTHCLVQKFPEGPIEFEHGTHALAVQIGRNGFPLNIPEAEVLADGIQTQSEALAKTAYEHYGWWFAPKKKRVTALLWDDEEGVNRKKKYDKLMPEYGEHEDRAIWAAVEVAKRNIVYSKTHKTLTNKNTGVSKTQLLYDGFEGAPVSKIKIKDFNPTSREMIIDRFTTVYDWEPVDFTDTGRPSVDDTVLQNLAGKVPMATELAEVFYLNKRLGQIKTGKNAWLKLVKSDGRIHHRLNTGGTVSGRCSHSSPNIAQVPKVKLAKVLLDDGSINPAFLKADGEPVRDIFAKDGGYKKAAILKGRAGDHGWDCRNLFYVPEGWVLVGCDLSGIELRCLANLAFPYDAGFLMRQIMEGDIHQTNMEAAGLATRDQAKTFIYALIYGAGDVKIGSIVDPLADVEKQRSIGKQLKAMFFARLPGLAAAVKQIQKQAKKGWLPGLDERKLFVRSKHSALNLRLQSDGAVIAKQWMLYSDDAFLDAGYKHGWDGDYAFLAFVHDELQVAVRVGMEEFAKDSMIQAAKLAGERYEFAMPVDAEAKHGFTWAETH
jgi:hypothetical protein